jgi:hypothetical protein
MIFERKNNPTTTQEITEFEQGRGVRLPQDYKEFLLSFNGGYVDRRNDYFKVGSWNAFAVEELFGITKSPETSISTRRFTNFSDHVRAKLLQIGSASGEMIFMDLRESAAHGKIYIRAHDSPSSNPILIDDTGFEEAGDYEEAQLFYPIADSFSKFVAMLGPEPE